MRENPRAEPKAILAVEPRKVVAYNSLVFALAITAFVLSTFFFEPGLHASSAVALGVLFTAFTWRTWRFLLRPPRLELYESGIHIQGMAFLRWRDFSFDATDQDLGIFTVWREDTEPPRKSDVGARVLYLNRKSGFLTIRFHFPNHLTNMRLDEFERQALALCEPEIGRKTPEANHPKTWRSLFFGKEEISGGEIVAYTLFLAVCGVVVFKSMKTNFFPSENWETFGVPLVIIASLLATVAFFRLVATGQVKAAPHVGRIQRSLGYAFFPALALGALYVTLYLGAGHLFTLTVGEPYTLTSQFTVRKSSLSDGTCFSSREFPTRLLQEFCFEYDSQFSSGASITGTVSGRASFFGRTTDILETNFIVR
ncbi:MAG: hypothetical protein EOM26_08400 [Alphaproteobacteria bacterium]|nr:hypothetical protein [Alphaproteobacteria bacterium]